MNPNTIQPYDPYDLPTGWERADGVETSNGTPSGNNILVQSSEGTTIPIEESPDSPTIERAEQMTVTHKLTMSWSEALTQLSNLKRGMLFWSDQYEDEASAIFKVLSVRIAHVAGNSATLEIVSEALNVDTPPAQFSITTTELGVSILKHPRYFYALKGSTADESLLNQMVIRIIQLYMDNPNINNRNAIVEQLYYSLDNLGTVTNGVAIPAADVTITQPSGTSPRTFSPLTGTNDAKLAAMEIISKHWLGIETPYIAGWQITYSTYYWTPPFLHPGGIIQDPYDTVDEQFLIAPDVEAIVNVPDDTIFAAMAAVNPTCYSSDGTAEGSTSISWLRKADTVTFERTFYRLDQTWIGSPVGHWDENVFSTGSRPTGAYHPTNNPNGYVNTTPTRLPPLPAVPSAA